MESFHHSESRSNEHDEGRFLRMRSIGKGYSIAHHGELLQGVFEEGAVSHYALITLPCNLFGSSSTFIPDTTSSTVVVEPADRIKACRAAELTLRECGSAGCGGRLLIESNIPVGWGFGSSTSECITASRSVADSHQIILSPNRIAKLVVRAEQASDSIMFDGNAILFAQREGIVLEAFSRQLPPLLILGFNTDESGRGVNTLDLPLRMYTVQEHEEFRRLRSEMRQAVELQSPSLIGRVASASACINQSYLPKPHFDRLVRIVERVGAAGLQVAHSGTIAGFIFDPHAPAVCEKMSLARQLVKELGFSETWSFSVSDQVEAQKDVEGFI